MNLATINPLDLPSVPFSMRSRFFESRLVGNSLEQKNKCVAGLIVVACTIATVVSQVLGNFSLGAVVVKIKL